MTYGDVPLLTGDALAALAAEHQRAGNAVTVLTASVPDPTGYGRIVRDPRASWPPSSSSRTPRREQRAISEINSGVYAFDGAVLTDALGRLTSANDQGERYLTDVVGDRPVDDGRRSAPLELDDPDEIEGVNDRVQLAELARRLNDRHRPPAPARRGHRAPTRPPPGSTRT